GCESGSAARARIWTHGFPVPEWSIFRSAPAGGHSNARVRPFGSLLQSSFCVAARIEALVVPATGVDSKALVNFRTASVPHALVIVSVHAPRGGGASAPRIPSVFAASDIRLKLTGIIIRPRLEPESRFNRHIG